MKIRRKVRRPILVLCVVLAAATVLWNAFCAVSSQIRVEAALHDSMTAEASQVLACYRPYADRADEGVSVSTYRELVASLFKSGLSQITQGEQIRHSMLMGYHESVISVPGREGMQSERERYPYVMAVFLVRCDEVLADGKPLAADAPTEGGAVRKYGYHLSVEEAVRLDPSYGEVKRLTLTSAVKKEGSAPLMEVGKQYLVWGKCLIAEDGTHELILTDNDMLPQDRTLGVVGDTLIYEATGRMPVCSEISGNLEAFYKTDNGRLWQESVLRLCDVSYHSVRVTAVESMQYLVAVRDGTVTLTQGRMIGEGDHEEGARVCLVSDEAAEINGWSLGDTVSLSLYQSEYTGGDFDICPRPAAYDPYSGFREEGTYEIVGIYHTEGWAGNGYGLHPATVVIPKNSLKNIYYQSIAPSVAILCDPEDLSLLRGELEDLRLLNSFRLIESSAVPSLSEESGQTTVRMVGNAVLAVCWLSLFGYPLSRHLRRYGLRRLAVNIREIFPYVGRRLRRDPKSGAFSVLLVAAVAFLMLTMQNRLAYQQEEMAQTYDKYPIRCTVSGISGTQTDYLSIPPRIYRLCAEEDGSLYPYVKQVNLLTRFVTVGQYVPTVTEEGLPDEQLLREVELVGINALAADERIPENSVIFFDGYSEADLAGDAAVCLVARSEEEPPTSIDFQVSARTRVTLTVIGTYSPTRTQQIFCPFDTLCRWREEMGKLPHAERLSFLVADPEELNLCKQELSRYFTEVDRNAAPTEEDALAIIIDDALFTESVYVLLRSILLFRVMLITLCILSVGISFLAAFLTVRGRKTELAIMCSLGKGRTAVYMTVLLEHLVFFAVGLIPALILCGLLYGALPSMRYLAVFLLCYIVGVSVAVVQTTRGRIMQVLKGNE